MRGGYLAGVVCVTGRAVLAVVPLLCTLALPAPAAAHQLYVFAYAQGRTIHGEAYFRGHLPAQNLVVHIFDPAGRELGQTQTDKEGKFTFEPQEQCDHRLVVETADGHQAEYVLGAEELVGTEAWAEPSAEPRGEPSTEPPGPALTPDAPSAADETAGPVRSASGPERAAQQAGAAQPAASSQSASVEAGSLAARIEALQAQVGALRRELNDYEQTVRLRDVLGGIGYILGLAGVAFYFLGIRRKQQFHRREDR